MIRGSSRGGGGNICSDQSIIVRRSAAIGDVLCSTVVADKLVAKGYVVSFQSQLGIHCVLRRIHSVAHISEPNGVAHIDLDGSYENDPQRQQKHFHAMFLEAANRQLHSRNLDLGAALNCKPKLIIRDSERDLARAKFVQYPKPWIFICPRSDTYRVRQVPDGIWQEAARGIPGTKFWLGRHPGPEGIIDLHAQHFDNVILWLSVADLLISVDTGPLHVAAAMGVPIVAINQSSSPDLHLSDQCDFSSVSPDLECLNCQKNLCPINQYLPPCQNVPAERIVALATARLNPHEVSAVVSVYKPDLGTLNKCLQALLPQVSEIVVVRDLAGQFPDGVLQDPRICYLIKGLHDIGYGRKVNYGARHTTGKNLLLINDDCFLEPNAVAKMLECMTDGVGMVSNLLRYPDGTIYHAGKVRSPGVRGWGHIDYRKYLPTFTEPVELENCCGCCVLVRREAFYAIDGFDEDYFVFAEDDDMSLRMRRAGWKIMFTPHSMGIHMEHQSIKKTGDIGGLLARANATFHKKWGPYLEHNLNRIPGDFSYLNK